MTNQLELNNIRYAVFAPSADTSLKPSNGIGGMANGSTFADNSHCVIVGIWTIVHASDPGNNPYTITFTPGVGSAVAIRVENNAGGLRAPGLCYIPCRKGFTVSVGAVDPSARLLIAFTMEGLAT